MVGAQQGCALAEEGGFRMSITVKYCIIGVSLGKPHTSVTYCTHVSVCSDHLPSAFKIEDRAHALSLMHRPHL